MTRLYFVGAPSLSSLITPELLAVVRDAAAPSNHVKGSIIQRRGERWRGMTIVREGVVAVGNPNPDGEFVATSVFGADHVFGEASLFADLPRSHEARAVEDVAIDRLDIEDYARLARKYRPLAAAIHEIMARRFHALVEFVDDLRKLPLNVQLAKLLVQLSATNSREAAVGANQEELAVMLGVSRVAIGTVLSRLERDGLVHRRYGRVELPDRAKLRDWVARRTMLVPLHD